MNQDINTGNWKQLMGRNQNNWRALSAADSSVAQGTVGPEESRLAERNG